MNNDIQLIASIIRRCDEAMVTLADGIDRLKEVDKKLAVMRDRIERIEHA